MFRGRDQTRGSLNRDEGRRQPPFYLFLSEKMIQYILRKKGGSHETGDTAAVFRLVWQQHSGRERVYHGFGGCGHVGAAITKALKLHGKTPTDIDGILLTHEHTDHVSGVNQLCKRYGLALYANAKTYQGMEAKMHDVPIGQARVFTTGEDFYVGNIAVHAFPIPHDAAEPVGYAPVAAGAKVAWPRTWGICPSGF